MASTQILQRRIKSDISIAQLPRVKDLVMAGDVNIYQTTYGWVKKGQ